MWLFRVAELFSYDFQTILHFADVAHANNGNLAGTDPVLDPKNTENNSETKKDAEERTLH